LPVRFQDARRTQIAPDGEQSIGVRQIGMWEQSHTGKIRNPNIEIRKILVVIECQSVNRVFGFRISIFGFASYWLTDYFLF